MAGARVVYYEDETGRRAACLPATKRGGRLTIRQRMRVLDDRPRGTKQPSDAEPRGPGPLYLRVRLDRDHGFQSIVIINSRAS